MAKVEIIEPHADALPGIATASISKKDLVPRALRKVGLRARPEPTISNRELKAGMIRILGAATAATYLALIRKNSVLRREMQRLVVAHSVF